MPLYKVRFSTKGIIDEMVINLDCNNETEAVDVLIRFYTVDNPIIISIVQTESVSSKSYSSNYFNLESNETIKTDPYAIISFSTSIMGFLFLPIVLVPICCIFARLSYYRIKENKSYKGKGLRIAGDIINTINIAYLIYQFKNGTFDIF